MPLYYSIHGGGMVLGSPVVDRKGNAALAAQHGFCCVSVYYRLAPEHIQPSQLQNCYSALKWCMEHAEELGIDTQKVALAGSSAGGGLAAGLALYVRDQKEFDIHHLRLRSQCSTTVRVFRQSIHMLASLFGQKEAIISAGNRC